ncbi:hypothetical protein CDV26_09065 [Francisella halioticida]|uniref:Lipopolysaccharide biosynthesis protein n=1 Tax=Francisella halioticida TaxID=549298 RepID=A0ABM6M0X3_9GAMM|nr:hypothetical protein [Francisella halioticida]ASG68519.1 hypothetical protein CDV26_09065 [Francisella halioticida]
MYLKGKKVLFIAPKFYDYHEQIINELKVSGFSVKYYPEICSDVFYRILIKTVPYLAYLLKKKYLLKILKDFEEDKYDIVFVIRGGMLDASFLEKMKSKAHGTKFIMYQWDSINQNDYLPFVKYFHLVKTFDRRDSKKYDLEYLPLFFGDKYRNVRNTDVSKHYDLVFYGAFHSDRLQLIQLIESQLKKSGYNFFYHLYITKLALFRMLVTGKLKLKDKKYLKTYKVNANSMISKYAAAKAVLDIELNIQSGLTIRTFETIGAGLKLITTNQNIKKESFYNANTVWVINRDALSDSDKLKFFFETEEKIDYYEQYYISNWLREAMS